MNCRVLYGIQNSCGDLLQASGNSKDFWVGYVSDLAVKFSLLQTGAISFVQFIPYNGLVKFEGQKYSNQFTYDLAVAPGGGISYTHKGAVKLMNLSTQDDVELQRLTQAQDAFIITADANESYFIYAPSNGFRAVAGQIKTTGLNAGEDTTSMISFESSEKVVPLRFSLGTTPAAIVSYLDALVR